MALKKEQQQKTLANRISVKRGAGYTSAASDMAEATNKWGQFVNNFTNFQLQEAKIEGELRGQKKARETEFGTKTITYTDNNGYQHQMDMVTPVAPPEGMGHTEAMAYDRHIYIQYKDSVKNSLSQIVTTTAKEVKMAGGTMQEFQMVTEGKTSKYIDQLPQEFHQVAKTMVNEKTAYLAPDVHESHMELIEKDSQTYVKAKGNGITNRYFDAIIVNNQEELAVLGQEIDEHYEIIATAPHLKSDLQKYNKYQQFKSQIDVLNNINKATKGALHHDPSDDKSDYEQTVANIGEIKNMIANPSIQSVNLVGDDGAIVTVTREQLKANVNEDYFHEAMELVKPKIDKMHIVSSSQQAKYKKRKELGAKYELGRDGTSGLALKDSADFFADAQLVQKALDDAAAERGLADEKEIIEYGRSMEFQGWLLEKHNIINPMISTRYKNFLANLDATKVDNFDHQIFHQMAQVPSSDSKLGLTAAQQNSKYQIERIMREQNKGFEEAVEYAKELRAAEREQKYDNNLQYNEKKIQLDKYTGISGVGSTIHDVLEDEDAILGHIGVTTLKRQILDRLKNGETITTDVIEDHVENWLEDIESGNNRTFIYSYSSIAGVVSLGDTYRSDRKVISRHAAEVYYKASDGEVNYMIPRLREKIKEYYKNTPDPRVNPGSWELGDTFADSNVKLSLLGNPARDNPEFGVYYYPGGVTHPVGFSDTMELMTLTVDEFKRERHAYEHYLKYGEGTWDEWRTTNRDKIDG